MLPTMVGRQRKFCEIKLLKQPECNSRNSKPSFYMSTKTGVKVHKFF